MTTRCGRTACMKVSIDGFSCDGRELRVGKVKGKFRRYRLRQVDKLMGKNDGSRSACASHLPEAFIQIVPSILSEVFPVLACTNRGLRPMRADNSSSASSSGLRLCKALVIGVASAIWLFSLVQN